MSNINIEQRRTEIIITEIDSGERLSQSSTTESHLLYAILNKLEEMRINQIDIEEAISPR